MSSELDSWTAEYLQLKVVHKDLLQFIRTNYEKPLATIARAWADSREPGLARPCDVCEVQVSTLVTPDEGWYFEWECSAGWGCSANTCGWHVPLSVIEVELPALLDAL